jgi:hypothetical protein
MAKALPVLLARTFAHHYSNRSEFDDASVCRRRGTPLILGRDSGDGQRARYDPLMTTDRQAHIRLLAPAPASAL